MVDCRNRYIGLARIPFHLITHDSVSIAEYDLAKTPVDARKAKDLVRTYELQGCERGNHYNFIDVKASMNALDGITLPSKTLSSVEEIPLLYEQVECLHGAHRLLAAREFYPDEEDWWWIARVFTHDLSQSEQATVAEQYANESHRLDGLIFRNILLHRREGDTEVENRWWSRLTERKRQDLKQLLKDSRYAKRFNDLVQWEGLWYPIRCGCIRRVLSMKCDEELLQYLDHIKVTWNHIVQVTDRPDIVDQSTVEHLETLAPGVSARDAETVLELFQRRQVFSKLTTRNEREAVRLQINGVEGLIPSLFTFFEYLKFLEPCAKAMRAIAPVEGYGSIRASLMASYTRPSQMTIEYGENDVRNHPSTSEDLDRTLCYLQLWLFVFRHYLRMSNVTARKNKKEAKPVALEPDPLKWEAFGRLAWRLGFDNNRVRDLRRIDGALQLATQIAKQWDFDDDPDLVGDLVEVLRRKPHKRNDARLPRLSSRKPLLKNMRCGRPYVEDQQLDATGQFLPVILNAPLTRRDGNVTTFLCKRDMFISFFGTANIRIDFDAMQQPLPSRTFEGRPGSDIQGDARSRGPEDSSCQDAKEELLADSLAAMSAQNTMLQAAVTKLDAENRDLKDDLISAQRETYQADMETKEARKAVSEAEQAAHDNNDRSLKENEVLRSELADEQDKARRLQQKLHEFQARFSESNGSSLYWKAGLQRIDISQTNELDDAEESRDLILVEDLEHCYRVPRDRVPTLLPNLRDACQFYLGDFNRLRAGQKTYEHMKKLPQSYDMAQVQIAWEEKSAGVLALRRSADSVKAGQCPPLVGKKRTHDDDGGASPLPSPKRYREAHSPSAKVGKGMALFRGRGRSRVFPAVDRSRHV